MLYSTLHSRLIRAICDYHRVIKTAHYGKKDDQLVLLIPQRIKSYPRYNIRMPSGGIKKVLMISLEEIEGSYDEFDEIVIDI